MKKAPQPETAAEELVEQIRDIYSRYGTDQVVLAIKQYRAEQDKIRDEQAIRDKIQELERQLNS
jgi:hypothetical protein